MSGNNLASFVSESLPFISQKSGSQGNDALTKIVVPWAQGGGRIERTGFVSLIGVFGCYGALNPYTA